MSDGRKPHRFPLNAPDGELIAWKCAACGKWCRDRSDDGECSVEWRRG